MNNNERLPRRRRWGRVVGIALAAATALTVAASSAHAVPPGDDDPTPPPSTGNEVISGTISLTNCPGVTKDHVEVIAVPTNVDSDAGGAVRASSTGAYRITGLPKGTFKVTPRLDPGLCKYGGGFSPTSRQVSASASGVNFTYRGPRQQLRVEAPVYAAALNTAVQGTGLHLDNYGPRHGQSFQLDNGSKLRLGGFAFPFTIAEKQYDLDCGLLCPDIGQARFYVDDMNMTSIGVGWTSPSFRATLAFESAGREIKGWYTDAPLGGPYDSLMPDFNVDNARLAVPLIPVAEGGRLSYRVGTVTLSANIQATGGCKLPVVGDVCGIVTDYKSTVKSEFQNRVRAKLSDPAVRALVATLLDDYLTEHGLPTLPTVDRVFIEGDDLVLVAY
jgi:hypothetical protein